MKYRTKIIALLILRLNRYFFISWHKHWKGIYIHLPKTTHRFYFDRKYKFNYDSYSNIGARIS